MLRRFEVKNFKCFKTNFVLDLTDTKSYEFNQQCIENDVVSKAMIYGPNGCGKSNLGVAIVELKTHLTDDKIDENYQHNYLNAQNDLGIAEFCLTFGFGDNIVNYRYGKESASKLVYETVEINGHEVISIDRRRNNIATIDLKGAETLKRDLGDSNISVIKYVLNNAVLNDDVTNYSLKMLFEFVNKMENVSTINGLTDINSNNAARLTEILLSHDNSGEVKGLETFLNELGVQCKLAVELINGKETLMFDYGQQKIDFFKTASSGTISLFHLYMGIIIFTMKKKRLDHQQYNLIPFIFIDEFDAYYHQKAAKLITKKLKDMQCQIILTTHNTSIMTNDLLRPDCYFIMDNESIEPIHNLTEKELRKAHNIEKMYKAGSFT